MLILLLYTESECPRLDCIQNALEPESETKYLAVMPTAHTRDIIAPSLVGGSEHTAESLWSFPIYPHTLTMMRSNRARWELGNVSCH